MDDTVILPDNSVSGGRESQYGAVKRTDYSLVLDELGVPVLPARDTSRTINLCLKRVMDLLLGGLAVVVLSPMLLFIAVAVRTTSPGPAIFSQRREGLRGAHFMVYKFRTMYADMGDASGSKLTTKGDLRVTRFGDFLRRSSLDELPQLFNVLKGEMSLVGPRPHPLMLVAAGRSYRELVPYYDLRDRMRPGITGWAQANGYRGPTDDPVKAKARIDYDIAYIQHFNVWMDVKIIFKTLRSEFLKGSGF